MGIDWTQDRSHAEWLELAAQLREQAAECMRRREESWDRSDTDGFLTQWAAQQMASRYQFQASVAEEDGTVVADALFRDGVALPTRMVEGRYGWQYAIRADYAQGARTVEWVGISHAQAPARRAAHYAKRGLTLGQVRVRVNFDRSGESYPLPQPPVAVIRVDENAAVSA